MEFTVELTDESIDNLIYETMRNLADDLALDIARLEDKDELYTFEKVDYDQFVKVRLAALIILDWYAVPE